MSWRGNCTSITWPTRGRLWVASFKEDVKDDAGEVFKRRKWQSKWDPGLWLRKCRRRRLVMKRTMALKKKKTSWRWKLRRGRYVEGWDDGNSLHFYRKSTKTRMSTRTTERADEARLLKLSFKYSPNCSITKRRRRNKAREEVERK